MVRCAFIPLLLAQSALSTDALVLRSEQPSQHLDLTYYVAACRSPSIALTMDESRAWGPTLVTGHFSKGSFEKDVVGKRTKAKQKRFRQELAATYIEYGRPDAALSLVNIKTSEPLTLDLKDRRSIQMGIVRVAYDVVSHSLSRSQIEKMFGEPFVPASGGAYGDVNMGGARGFNWPDIECVRSCARADVQKECNFSSSQMRKLVPVIKSFRQSGFWRDAQSRITVNPAKQKELRQKSVEKLKPILDEAQLNRVIQITNQRFLLNHAGWYVCELNNVKLGRIALTETKRRQRELWKEQELYQRIRAVEETRKKLEHAGISESKIRSMLGTDHHLQMFREKTREPWSEPVMELLERKPITPNRRREKRD